MERYVNSLNPNLYVVTLGASLTANKGAAAMLTTVNQRLPEHLGSCSFFVLSTDPVGDRDRQYELKNAEVLDLRPLRLAFIETPLAITAMMLRTARVPSRLVPRSRIGRALSNSNVAIDLAGISFVDSRGYANLMYNTLMTLLPILHGVPTVKAAQAIGPCNTWVSSHVAKAVLSRLRWIGARGDQTRTHLDELGLHNAETVADIAFSLDEAKDLPTSVETLLPTGEFVAVMPSIVVERLFNKDPNMYVNAMAEMVEHLADTSHLPIVLAPHSYERSERRHRMNDRPTLLELGQRLAHRNDVVVIDDELTAGQLRSLIAKSSFLVTSRFHAMISALATCTPLFVIGWSHKYREVLGDFGLEQLGVSHDALKRPHETADRINEQLQCRQHTSAKIRHGLPAVIERSEHNFVRIAEFTRAGRS